MVKELLENEDLEELIERSRTDPILIFKHSTQCSISSAAYDEFLKFTEDADDVVCGVVLVLENRRLSNTIASRFGVRHESPQAIVLRDGRPYWNASHWAITTDALSKATKG